MSSRKHTVLTVLDLWCSVLQCCYPYPSQGRHDISGHVPYSGPPLLPTQPWLDIDDKWACKLSPRNNAGLPSVENPRSCQLAIPRSIFFRLQRADSKAGFDLYEEYFRSRNTRESRKPFVHICEVPYLPYVSYLGTSTILIIRSYDEGNS